MTSKTTTPAPEIPDWDAPLSEIVTLSINFALWLRYDCEPGARGEMAKGYQRSCEGNAKAAHRSASLAKSTVERVELSERARQWDRMAGEMAGILSALIAFKLNK